MSRQQHDESSIGEGDRGNGAFEVLGKPSVAIDPREEPLEAPATRQHLEVDLVTIYGVPESLTLLVDALFFE